MKKNFLPNTLAGFILAASFVTNQVSASLINTDANSFIDQTSNLEWMDFGINNHQSYDYVTSNLDTGDIYEGWRLPTEDEVIQMVYNTFFGLGADIEEDNRDGQQNQYLSARDRNRQIDNTLVKASVFDNISPIIGANIQDDFSNRSIGIFRDSDGLLSYMYFQDIIQFSGNWSDSLIVEGRGKTYSIGSDPQEYYSTLLIRQSSGAPSNVPEPTTLAIFVFGLIALALPRFKKN